MGTVMLNDFFCTKMCLPFAVVVDPHAVPAEGVVVGVAALPIGVGDGDQHLARGVYRLATGPIAGIVVVGEVARDRLTHRNSKADAEANDEEGEELKGGRHGRLMG